MEFQIVVHINQRSFRMQVKRIYLSESIERFEVKGGNRSIIFKNNRPLLKTTNSRKKPLWQIEEGAEPIPPHTFALIVLAIEKKIKEYEAPGSN